MNETKKTCALVQTLLQAFLAGFCIAIGGTVFLRLKDAFPGGNVAGAFLFSVGLFTICTKGFALFTGKACYLLQQGRKTLSYCCYLALVWIGNLLGASALAALEKATTVGNGLRETAKIMIESKMSCSYLSLFLLGLLCNVLIYIAVSSYARNPHEAGKYIGLILAVMTFILVGSEHSVADMYYWAVSGVLLDLPAESFLRLVIISLGNVVGGALFCQLEHWATVKKSE